MPVQFRLTSAMSNSITPGVATDHQSPKRGETQVRQNPLRPSLLAQSSMGKQMKPPRSKLRGITRKGIVCETPRFLTLFPLQGNLAASSEESPDSNRRNVSAMLQM